MTEYICKEVQADNGGYLEPVKELIRCKDCKWWNADTCMEWFDTPYAPAYGYCFRAERKEK